MQTRAWRGLAQVISQQLKEHHEKYYERTEEECCRSCVMQLSHTPVCASLLPQSSWRRRGENQRCLLGTAEVIVTYLLRIGQERNFNRKNRKIVLAKIKSFDFDHMREMVPSSPKPQQQQQTAFTTPTVERLD